MVVNSSKYGGSGGWVATTSAHGSSYEITVHELGHSFADLADEYWVGSQYAREAANMTQESNPSKIKWKVWLNFNGIGIYEYESPGIGWYRPHQNCKMRYLGQDFCSVCTEAFIETIHNLIIPIEHYYPVNKDISPDSLPKVVKVDLIKPNPNTLKIDWILNEQKIAGNIDSVIINEDMIKTGSNQLVVNVIDTTELVRTDSHFASHVYSVTWNIGTNGTLINKNRKINKTKLIVYPNPAREFINIEYETDRRTSVIIELIDLEGKTIKTFINERHPKGHYSYQFTLTNIHNGIYFLRLIVDNTIIRKKIIKL